MLKMAPHFYFSFQMNLYLKFYKLNEPSHVKMKCDNLLIIDRKKHTCKQTMYNTYVLNGDKQKK